MEPRLKENEGPRDGQEARARILWHSYLTGDHSRLNLLPSLRQIFAVFVREVTKRKPAQRKPSAIACSVVIAAPVDQANS